MFASCTLSGIFILDKYDDYEEDNCRIVSMNQSTSNITTIGLNPNSRPDKTFNIDIRSKDSTEKYYVNKIIQCWIHDNEIVLNGEDIIENSRTATYLLITASVFGSILCLFMLYLIIASIVSLILLRKNNRIRIVPTSRNRFSVIETSTMRVTERIDNIPTAQPVNLGNINSREIYNSSVV
jgi:hypothetical protein